MQPASSHLVSTYPFVFEPSGSNAKESGFASYRQGALPVLRGEVQAIQSPETVEFVEQATIFRKNPTCKLAKEIFDCFIDDDRSNKNMEINIDSDVHKKINPVIGNIVKAHLTSCYCIPRESVNPACSNHVAYNMFDQCCDEMHNLLSMTYDNVNSQLAKDQKEAEGT